MGSNLKSPAPVSAHESWPESSLLFTTGPAAHPIVTSAHAAAVAPGVALGTTEIVSSMVSKVVGLRAAKVVHPHATHASTPAHIANHASTHSPVHWTKDISIVAEVALVASEHVATHGRPGS